MADGPKYAASYGGESGDKPPSLDTLQCGARHCALRLDDEPREGVSDVPCACLASSSPSSMGSITRILDALRKPHADAAADRRRASGLSAQLETSRKRFVAMELKAERYERERNLSDRELIAARDALKALRFVLDEVLDFTIDGSDVTVKVREGHRDTLIAALVTAGGD